MAFGTFGHRRSESTKNGCTGGASQSLHAVSNGGVDVDVQHPHLHHGNELPVRLGIADHFGWAVAVTVNADHEVVDRRRIELVEPDVCAAPIHYEGKRLGLAGTAALVVEVRASAVRATAAALDQLASASTKPCGRFRCELGRRIFPLDIAVQLRTPYEARADAVMYRQVLSEAAHARGWNVHLYEAKHVEGQAAAVLGESSAAFLQRPRETLGPPWTKDHRVALASAIVA